MVEKRICEYLKRGKIGRLSDHDKVWKTPIGIMSYTLWASLICQIYDDESIYLGVQGSCYQTRTTKSRINAIAQFFGLPSLYSKRGAWYWSDGVEYTGGRLFGEKKAENSQYLLNI